MPFGQYIPALLDGSSAADGSAITNPGGYPSNGAEPGTLQTHADKAVFGGISAWGDGASWTGMSYEDMTQHPNGALGLWFMWKLEGAVWVVDFWIQWDVTRLWIAAEIRQNERYFTPYPGTGFAARRDVDGNLQVDINGHVRIASGL